MTAKSKMADENSAGTIIVFFNEDLHFMLELISHSVDCAAPTSSPPTHHHSYLQCNLITDLPFTRKCLSKYTPQFVKEAFCRTCPKLNPSIRHLLLCKDYFLSMRVYCGKITPFVFRLLKWPLTKLNIYSFVKMFDFDTLSDVSLLSVSDVTTGRSVLLWPDQTCFLTPAREHTNIWKSSTNVCPTVRTPLFSLTL